MVKLLGPTKNMTEQESRLYIHSILGVECSEKDEYKELIRQSYPDQLGRENDSDILFTATPISLRNIHRQTVSMWKASMDLGLRWRRLKKRQNICLQPLNTFPDFIMDFSCTQYDGLFELLQSFSR